MSASETSYREHLSSRAQFSIVDERAHRGKRTIKALLNYVEALTAHADACRKEAGVFAKAVPSVEGHTTRYGLHKIEFMHEAQEVLYNGLKESLARDAKKTLEDMLNDDFRGQYPRLQARAKELGKTLGDLEKTERDLHKKSLKAISNHQQLRHEIFEGNKVLTQHHAELSRSMQAAVSHGAQRSSSAGARGETTSRPVSLSADLEDGPPKRRASLRSQIGGKKRWGVLKKVGRVLSGRHLMGAEKESGNFDNHYNHDGNGTGGRTRKEKATSMDKKSIRKISQNMAKLIKKSDAVAEAEVTATNAHAEAAARLLEGLSVYNEKMGPILDEFQELEVNRSTVCKDVLKQILQHQMEHHRAMVAMIETTLEELEEIDPTTDVDYFIRGARSVANPWRRLSGNIPCITQEYHKPVSPWMQILDGDSGCYFYMHNETGETKWDRPGPGVEVQPSYADLNVVPPVLPLPSMVLKEEQQKMWRDRGNVDSSDWDAVEDEET